MAQGFRKDPRRPGDYGRHAEQRRVGGDGERSGLFIAAATENIFRAIDIETNEGSISRFDKLVHRKEHG